MAQKILVVDDEAVLRETIAYNLEQAGYMVISAATGAAALEAARREKPDLVILDIMLPDIDGIEVCRRLRREAGLATIPILILTAKGEEIDKVIGLEVGADDYVTKPFGRRELLSRVRALLRRSEYVLTGKMALVGTAASDASSPPGELVAGPLRIDLAGRHVFIGDAGVQLQAKQFDLLVYFVRNRGTVLTRDQLLNRVWGTIMRAIRELSMSMCAGYGRNSRKTRPTPG